MKGCVQAVIFDSLTPDGRRSEGRKHFGIPRIDGGAPFCITFAVGRNISVEQSLAFFPKGHVSSPHTVAGSFVLVNVLSKH